MGYDCPFAFQPLPELPRIPGLVLSGSTFSDCLMVVQFLRNFGKVLGFDVNLDVPSLSVLQEGLLNIGDSMGEVQDLLVRLLSAAICDPGLITGYKVTNTLQMSSALARSLINTQLTMTAFSDVMPNSGLCHYRNELSKPIESHAPPPSS